MNNYHRRDHGQPAATLEAGELERQVATVCKAIALYQERSPEINRLPSTIMRLVTDLQYVVAGDEKCETSTLEENVRSAKSGTGQSQVSEQHSDSLVTGRKKVTHTPIASDDFSGMLYRMVIEDYFEGRDGSERISKYLAAIRAEAQPAPTVTAEMVNEAWSIVGDRSYTDRMAEELTRMLRINP